MAGSARLGVADSWVCVLAHRCVCVCVGVCLPKLGRNCRKMPHFTEASRNASRPLKHTHVVGMSLWELSVSGDTWDWRFQKAAVVISKEFGKKLERP